MPRPPDIAEMLRYPPPEIERRVMEAALSRRFVLISRRPTVMVYMSRSGGDYVVMPRLYCSCPAFTARLRAGPPFGCHHVYAAPIALREGRYHDVSGRVDAVVVVEEIASMGYSPTLRRAVFTDGSRPG